MYQEEIVEEAYYINFVLILQKLRNLHAQEILSNALFIINQLFLTKNYKKSFFLHILIIANDSMVNLNS